MRVLCCPELQHSLDCSSSISRVRKLYQSMLEEVGVGLMMAAQEEQLPMGDRQLHRKCNYCCTGTRVMSTECR